MQYAHVHMHIHSQYTQHAIYIHHAIQCVLASQSAPDTLSVHRYHSPTSLQQLDDVHKLSGDVTPPPHAATPTEDIKPITRGCAAVSQ